jgi:hypothetical protein
MGTRQQRQRPYPYRDAIQFSWSCPPKQSATGDFTHSVEAFDEIGLTDQLLCESLKLDRNKEPFMAPNLNVVDGIERSMLLVLNNAYRLRKVALECVHHEGRIVVEAENMVKESTPIEGNLSAVPALSLPYDVWFPAHRHLLTGSEIDRTLFEGCHKLFPMSPIVPQFTQCQKGKKVPNMELSIPFSDSARYFTIFCKCLKNISNAPLGHYPIVPNFRVLAG